MDSFHADFEVSGYLPILLLRIGNTSQAKFDLFAKEIESVCRTVEIQNSLGVAQTVLRFRFIHDAAVDRTDWDDYLVHRRPLAIIGVFHCQSSPDLSAAYKEFQHVTSDFIRPGFPVRLKLYAFDPSDAQSDRSDLTDLVLFPPKQEHRLRFYISTQFHDLCFSLMQDLELMIRTLPTSDVLLKSPLDAYSGVLPAAASSSLAPSSVPSGFSSTSGATDELARNKRLRAGRREKQTADFCLLAGAPHEALAHYKAATELCRSQNDWLWCAGALEGQCAATIIAVFPIDFHRFLRSCMLRRNQMCFTSEFWSFTWMLLAVLPKSRTRLGISVSVALSSTLPVR